VAGPDAVASDARDGEDPVRPSAFPTAAATLETTFPAVLSSEQARAGVETAITESDASDTASRTRMENPPAPIRLKSRAVGTALGFAANGPDRGRICASRRPGLQALAAPLDEACIVRWFTGKMPA
jgi:hypothetical protein